MGKLRLCSLLFAVALIVGCPVDDDDTSDDDVTSDDDDTTADDDDVTSDDDDSSGDDDDDDSAADADGDGWTVDQGDCDDTDPTVNPDADEVCGDHADNDCDGTDNGCSHHGEIQLGAADARMLGEAPEDIAGRALGIGDVDGDGLDDMVIGAPYESTNAAMAGAVYAITCLPPASGSLGTAAAKLTGIAVEDRAGKDLSVGGDTDGDGTDDILVGVPYHDGGGEDAGAALLVRGPVAGETSLSGADAVLMGEEPGDHAGCYVDNGGDVDGDGLADLLVGAYKHAATGFEAGAVYLVTELVSGDVGLDAATAKFTGAAAEDHLGYSMACGCDLDADGYDDVSLGAYGADANGGNSGAVYVFRGPVSGVHGVAAADARLMGEGGGNMAGYGSACAGDVDGDGYDDLIVGAYNATGSAPLAGAAYLVRGPVSGDVLLSAADARFLGESQGDRMGFQVAGMGDVNADGFGDVLVGAPWADGQAGYAWLIHGPISGDVTAPDLRIAAEDLGDGDRAGLAISLAGDIDGDGYDDLLVGAPRLDHVGHDAGAAYLIFGTGG